MNVDTQSVVVVLAVPRSLPRPVHPGTCSEAAFAQQAWGSLPLSVSVKPVTFSALIGVGLDPLYFDCCAGGGQLLTPGSVSGRGAELGDGTGPLSPGAACLSLGVTRRWVWFLGGAAPLTSDPAPQSFPSSEEASQEPSSGLSPLTASF